MQNLQSNPLQGLWSTVCRLFMLTTFFVGFGLTAMPDVKGQMSGAIFTTDVGGETNVNIYGYKTDVYLNGGPAHVGAAGLPPGNYYCKVTTPNGDLLGQTNGPTIVVLPSGEFTIPYHLVDILFKASGAPALVPGFDTTTNSGGEYKVWVSMDITFPGGATKTDNFKVLNPDVVNPPPPPPPPVVETKLCVEKFYDANVNGEYDEGELLLTGWQFVLSGDNYLPSQFGSPSCTFLLPGNYTVTELDSIEDHWIHTTDTVIPVTLLEGDDTTLFFGNVCIGAGGGKTLGFWSNKNGQKLIGADDLALLSALTLRNANGSDFNPGSAGALRTWLLNGNAVNMAYMLSVQLTAMELNVHNELVTAGHKIYAPDLSDFLGEGDGLNPLGFISIEDLMDAAEAALVADGDTLAGDSNRAYQEALKDALDDANNNLNFLQAAPCPFSFATP